MPRRSVVEAKELNTGFRERVLSVPRSVAIAPGLPLKPWRSEVGRSLSIELDPV
jgi:hypothetical protein